MIGRIITASTIPAVKMLPPPLNETLPDLNSGNQPRWALRNPVSPSNLGARMKIPHRPNTMDGTAASRSMTLLNHRDNRFGA